MELASYQSDLTAKNLSCSTWYTATVLIWLPPRVQIAFFGNEVFSYCLLRKVDWLCKILKFHLALIKLLVLDSVQFRATSYHLYNWITIFWVVKWLLIVLTWCSFWKEICFTTFFRLIFKALIARSVNHSTWNTSILCEILWFSASLIVFNFLWLLGTLLLKLVCLGNIFLTLYLNVWY